MHNRTNNHFGKIPHGWFDDNEFIQSLTPAERWIMVCLASYIWRSEKPDPEYAIDKKLVRLYRENGLLVTLMSQRTIESKCGHNRSTVCNAIDRFDDVGAVIKVPGRKGKGFSNLYIMGLTGLKKQKNGRVSARDEYLFSNSPVLRSGGEIPEDVKDFVRSNYNKKMGILRFANLPGFDKPLYPLIFGEQSPLIPRQDDYLGMEETDRFSKTKLRMAEPRPRIGWFKEGIWLENGEELAGLEPASKEF
jgi:hypothetical protein